jgi:hypothetical protein
VSDGKKLIEYDPRTLDLARLTILEGSLIAKLLSVSRELVQRYTKLMEVAAEMPNPPQEAREVFATGLARRIKLMAMLEDELSQRLKPEEE